MSLPEPVRKRLNSFSRTVFTDHNRTGPENRGEDNTPDHPTQLQLILQDGQVKSPSLAAQSYACLLRSNEIVSNLPLQMSLYFNLCFFPFWWVSSVVMLHLKYPILADYYKFILLTVIILTTLIEIIRLYLGYVGNLQEKVPELAGFWLLSLLLQLPLVLFLLLNEGLKIQPLERAVHIIFVTFLVIQVITAFLALKKMVNQLATRFHLHDFDQLNDHLPSDHLAWKKRRVEAPCVIRPPVEEMCSTSVG